MGEGDWKEEGGGRRVEGVGWKEEGGGWKEESGFTLTPAIYAPETDIAHCDHVNIDIHSADCRTSQLHPIIS